MRKNRIEIFLSVTLILLLGLSLRFNYKLKHTGKPITDCIACVTKAPTKPLEPLEQIKVETIQPIKKIQPEPVDLAEINNIRAGHGLSRLVWSGYLQQSANDKAKDMDAGDYWSHNTPSGRQFSDFIFKYNDWFSVGENLAKCFNTDNAMLDAWVKSPPHYKNIVGDWKYFGAYRQYDASQHCTIVVHHFAS